MVRDVTDINNPSTLATVDVPDWYWDPRGALAFVGSAYVGAIRYPGDGTSQLVLTHYPGAPKPLIEAYGYGVAAFAWSPDGTSIAYLVDTWSTQQWEWYVASNGVDRFVAYTPGLCHCGEGIVDLYPGIWLDYSQDGRYMSFVETNGLGELLQVRTADGVLVTSIDNANSRDNYLIMPVWSGNKLYFRDAQGVEVWDNGAIKPFLPGVAWADPRSSPAGGLIAYSAPDASGVPHAFTVETATGKVRQLAARGSHQVHFLTNRYVWYRGAIHCPATEYCLLRVSGQGYKDTGVNYIFDLATGAEYISKLSGVADTWPHGA